MVNLPKDSVNLDDGWNISPNNLTYQMSWGQLIRVYLSDESLEQYFSLTVFPF